MNYDKYSEVIIPPEANLKLPTNNNSRYFYNNKIKELVLDIAFNDHSEDKPREFELKLPDPLIIDVEHDIFLDSVVTYNLRSAILMRNMAFAIFIDQFNIQTKVATNIKQINTGADIGGNTNIVVEGKTYRLISNDSSDASTQFLAPIGDATTGPDLSTLTVGGLFKCVLSGTFSKSKVQEVGTQAQPINKLNNAIIIPNEKTHETVETFVITSVPSASTITVSRTPSTNITDQTICLIHGSKNGVVNTTVIGKVSGSTATLTISNLVSVVTGAPITDLSNIVEVNVDIIQIFNEHNNHSTIHKGRKHNYVGTITPSKLINITGSISDVGEYIVNQNDPTGNSHYGSEIKFRSPFRDRITQSGTGPGTTHHHNLERMIVEFKLVPRQ